MFLSPGPSTGIYTTQVTPDGAVLADVFPTLPVVADSHIELLFDGENHLLVWPELYDGGSRRIRGARLTRDGTLLDPTGFDISADLTPSSRYGNIAAAFDGTNTTVAWSEYIGLPDGEQVHAARVTPEGVVLDPTPILVGAAASPYEQIEIDAALDDSDTVIAWTSWGYSYPQSYGWSPARAVLLHRDGGVTSLAGAAPGPAHGVALTSSGAGVLLTWATSPDTRPWSTFARVIGARLSAAREPLDPKSFAISAHASAQEGRSVSFDGQNTRITWLDGRDLVSGEESYYGVRVSAEGAVLDAPPTVASPTPVALQRCGSANLLTASNGEQRLDRANAAQSGAHSPRRRARIRST